jgi:hypothetical protein
VAELLAQDAPAWSQFVRDFDGAYKSFVDNRNALMQLGPYIQTKHRELLPQYTSLVQRANDLAPKLQALADTRAKVSGWLGSLGKVYQSAVDATSIAIERAAGLVGAARRALGLGELGIAPVIVVVGAAAAAGALVLVTKWVSDTYLFAQRLNAMQALEAKGYGPEQAAAAVNQVMGPPNAPGGLERTASTILWIVAALIIGGPIIKQLLSSSSSGRASE